MIMQSDVFAEDNKWLYNMGETLNSLKDYGIKMVAPLTNNPMVDDDRLYGKKGEKKEDYVLKEGFLPMYCVMSHRELFKRVGFLKEYPYAGVEAEEYAYRMRAMGYKQAICGSSWVNHVGGATLSRFENNTKVQEILQKARDEFGLPLKKEVVGG
jgi:GT2 family glycosyltransferase